MLQLFCLEKNGNLKALWLMVTDMLPKHKQLLEALKHDHNCDRLEKQQFNTKNTE